MNAYEVAFAHGLLRSVRAGLVELAEFLDRHGCRDDTKAATQALSEGLGLLKDLIQREHRPGPDTVPLRHVASPRQG